MAQKQKLKTREAINVPMGKGFRDFIAEIQRSTGVSYAEAIARAVPEMTETEIAHASSYGGDGPKKAKVFNIKPEINQRLDEMKELSGRSKSALVHAAFVVFQNRLCGEPSLKTSDPFLVALDDVALVDELRRRGYEVTKL